MVNGYRLDKVLKQIKEIIGTGKLMILKHWLKQMTICQMISL